jgi:hypothetical protein
MPSLVDYANQYCADKSIARTPVYAAKRFASIVGDLRATSVTQSHIDSFVSQARANNMPEPTIYGAVKDVRLLVASAGGTRLTNPVKKPKPDPKPCEIVDIDTIWPWLAPWSCQLVVLTYWCGVRLDDAISIQLQTDPGWKSITWKANKTRHLHRIPVPRWITEWLRPVRLPYSKSNDHAQVIVRGELDRVCQIAHVSRILPSEIRDRGITEWSKVSSDAGAILHGHGLGTRDHYVPALEILTSAMDRVRVPVSFGASATSEESLLAHFRRLDPSAQGLITGTAERLAAG